MPCVDGIALASVVTSGVLGLAGLCSGPVLAKAQRRHDRDLRLREDRRASYARLLEALDAADHAVWRARLAMEKQEFPLAEDEPAPPAVVEAEKVLREVVLRMYDASLIAPSATQAVARDAAKSLNVSLGAAIRGQDPPSEATDVIDVLAHMRRDLAE